MAGKETTITARERATVSELRRLFRQALVYVQDEKWDKGLNLGQPQTTHAGGRLIFGVSYENPDIGLTLAVRGWNLVEAKPEAHVGLKRVFDQTSTPLTIDMDMTIGPDGKPEHTEVQIQFIGQHGVESAFTVARSRAVIVVSFPAII